jgi:hypothetical protein
MVRRAFPVASGISLIQKGNTYSCPTEGALDKSCLDCPISGQKNGDFGFLSGLKKPTFTILPIEWPQKVDAGNETESNWHWSYERPSNGGIADIIACVILSMHPLVRCRKNPSSQQPEPGRHFQNRIEKSRNHVPPSSSVYTHSFEWFTVSVSISLSAFCRSVWFNVFERLPLTSLNHPDQRFQSPLARGLKIGSTADYSTVEIAPNTQNRRPTNGYWKEQNSINIHNFSAAPQKVDQTLWCSPFGSIQKLHTVPWSVTCIEKLHFGAVFVPQESA